MTKTKEERLLEVLELPDIEDNQYFQIDWEDDNRFFSLSIAENGNHYAYVDNHLDSWDFLGKENDQRLTIKSIKTMGDFIKAYDDGWIDSDCGWDDVYIDNPGITKDTPVVLRDGEVRICNIWTIGEYNG